MMIMTMYTEMDFNLKATKNILHVLHQSKKYKVMKYKPHNKIYGIEGKHSSLSPFVLFVSIYTYIKIIMDSSN